MTNPNSEKRNANEVRAMFSRVAKLYDLINRAMCCGLDIKWRAMLVDELLSEKKSGTKFVDIACGSGDVALRILTKAPDAEVVGVDFCPEMLSAARDKIKDASTKSPVMRFSERISFVEADCKNLPFDVDEFDGATIAFGFRNFEDRLACLKEIRRTLKAGGRLCSLEVARATGIFAPIQAIFMKWVVPTIGTIFGGKWADYRYLGETTLAYPKNEQVEALWQEAGFKNIKTTPLILGFISITSAET